MTLPFEFSKPEARPVKVVFITDERTGLWLEDLQKTNDDIEISLISHRSVRAARENAESQEPPKRRASDAAEGPHMATFNEGRVKRG